MSKPLSSQIERLRDRAAIQLLEQMQHEQIPLTSTAIDTAYVQQGQHHPSILLLHGFDSSLLEFRYLMPLLSTHYQTWAIDCFGFGFTQRSQTLPVHPITIRQHLYQTWQFLINEPVILVGASLGGAIAIDFALNHPNCVSKLVLIDSVGFSGSFSIGQWIFPPFDTIAVEWLRLRKWMALTAAETMPNSDQHLIDAIRCSLLHHDVSGWSDATISFTKSGGYWELSRKIAQVQHPTLVLWGETDDVLGTGDAEKFRDAIKNSQLIWMQNCGHNPHLEQSQVTAEHILNFI